MEFGKLVYVDGGDWYWTEGFIEWEVLEEEFFLLLSLFVSWRQYCGLNCVLYDLRVYIFIYLKIYKNLIFYIFFEQLGSIWGLLIFKIFVYS